MKYNFHRGDYVAINSELQAINWGQMENLDVKESWKFFQDKLQDSIQKHIPLRRQSKKKQKWMDSKYLDAVRKKHRAWNRYLHTQNQIDYFDYCKVRNACTRTTRTSKRKYEKNIVMNMKDNQKDFWAYVCQKTKCKAGVSDLKD